MVIFAYTACTIYGLQFRKKICLKSIFWKKGAKKPWLHEICRYFSNWQRGKWFKNTKLIFECHLKVFEHSFLEHSFDHWNELDCSIRLWLDILRTFFTKFLTSFNCRQELYTNTPPPSVTIQIVVMGTNLPNEKTFWKVNFPKNPSFVVFLAWFIK